MKSTATKNYFHFIISSSLIFFIFIGCTGSQQITDSMLHQSPESSEKMTAIISESNIKQEYHSEKIDNINKNDFNPKKAKGERSSLKNKVIMKCYEAANMIKNKGIDYATQELYKKKSSFVWSDSYIFLMDIDGKILAHPFAPKLKGRNMLTIKDLKGKYFFWEFVQVAKSEGEGWVISHWPKLKESSPAKKYCYIYRIPDTPYFVGAGTYNVVDSELLAEIEREEVRRKKELRMKEEDKKRKIKQAKKENEMKKAKRRAEKKAKRRAESKSSSSDARYHPIGGFFSELAKGLRELDVGSSSGSSSNSSSSRCSGSLNVRVEQYSPLGDFTAESFSVKIKGVKGVYYENKKQGGSGFFKDSSAQFYGMCDGEYEIIVSGCNVRGKCKSAKVSYKFHGGSRSITYNVGNGYVREQPR